MYQEYNSHGNRLVLGQRAVDAKSNEIKAIQAAFDRLDSDPAAVPHFTTESLETTRGRNEVRRVTTLDALQHLPEDILFGWPQLETLVRIESAAKRGGKTVSETRYFISTLPMREVETIGQGIRSHWGIENKLHWVLDVAFREDGNRTRKGNGPECSAILRQMSSSRNPHCSTIAWWVAVIGPCLRQTSKTDTDQTGDGFSYG